MVARNPNMIQLGGSYLFPEVAKRKNAFLEEEPDAPLISLGIGDTTEPLPKTTVKGLRNKVEALGTADGYTGYGSYQGDPLLRERIAATFYPGIPHAGEITISDGSKPDIGRLAIMFGPQATVSLQDPAYPVYVDASKIVGQTNITFLPCTASNRFFPNLDTASRTDLIYFCSPNNPTGACATKEHLTALVAFAQKNRSIILYDAVYSGFIRDDSLPKSIYEIPGAREVAIELGSFSKIVGFTGVRLGWTVVPTELKFDDGTPVSQDWSRINSTLFNAASNIAQAGGIAALEEEGIADIRRLTDFYLDNAKLLREAVESKGLTCYGGKNAPYLWVDCQGKDSWDVFDQLLRKAHLICTPGSGFGPAGQGFIRLSAFGGRQAIETAAHRLGLLDWF